MFRIFYSIGIGWTATPSQETIKQPVVPDLGKTTVNTDATCAAEDKNCGKIDTSKGKVVKNKQILIIGATGYRANVFTERLLKSKNTDVYILSRGNYYWDTKDFKDKAKKPYDCDIREGLNHCSDINQRWFDGCVDFFSQTKDDIKKLLNLNCDHYILISDHSVYKTKSADLNFEHKQDRKEKGFQEDDAELPAKEMAPNERYKIKDRQKKGWSMLEAEIRLKNNFEEGGFPYTILRPTNIYSKRQNGYPTYWHIHHMIQAHNHLELPLKTPDKELVNIEFSVTSGVEIAQVINEVFRQAFNTTCCPENVKNEIFNVANHEAPKRIDLYSYIGNPFKISITHADGPDWDRTWPDWQTIKSDTTKLKNKLGFRGEFISTHTKEIGFWYERVAQTDKFKKYKEEFWDKIDGWHGAGTWARKYYPNLKIEKRLSWEDEQEEWEEMSKKERKKAHEKLKVEL